MAVDFAYSHTYMYVHVYMSPIYSTWSGIYAMPHRIAVGDTDSMCVLD